MEKYVIYIRKSSESEERQVMSLDAQESEMLTIAKRDDLNIVDIIKESHSAKRAGQRPAFNKMIRDIEAGKYNAILTWAPDRLSRNAGDLGTLIDLMDTEKLICVQTYTQLFKNNPNDKFMLMMFGSQAKLENDQRSMNVKRGNREKLKRGDWINFAPFGYLNDKATRTVALDPVRAPFLIEMFQRYSTGLYSFKQLSNLFYEQGLRTKKGNKVYGGNIQRFLQNPFYYGVMRSNGKLYPGNHEPLISKKLFDQCQEVSGVKTKPRAKTKGFTLSGFITCAKCGCAATAEKKKGRYIYYHCTNGKGVCNQRSFNANENSLHLQIAEDMKRLRINQNMVDIVYRGKLEELEQSDEFDTHAIDSAKQALESLKMRKSRLVDTFTNGDINDALYQEKLSVINNDIVNLEQQIKELEQNHRNPYETIELIYNEFKRCYTMSERYIEASPDEKRTMLADALSNSELLDRNIVSLQYKSPYDVFARTPENASFSQLRRVRDSNP